MKADQPDIDLPLPATLVAFIATGSWPSGANALNDQGVRPLVSPQAVERFAPRCRQICLYPPPFVTVARMAAVEDQLRERGALDQIVPDRTLIIGDFGVGADAYIILNYADDPVCPSVFRQHRSSAGLSSWVLGASTFDEFAGMIGLFVGKA